MLYIHVAGVLQVFKTVKFGMLDLDNSGQIDLRELTQLLFTRYVHCYYNYYQ
jgi:hypothetical protein